MFLKFYKCVLACVWRWIKAWSPCLLGTPSQDSVWHGWLARSCHFWAPSLGAFLSRSPTLRLLCVLR